MIDPPKSRAEAQRRTYGHGLWGKEKFNPARCAYEVASGYRAPTWNQCTRKPGYGPDQLYCKQHDPATIAAKRAARERAYHQRVAFELRPYRQRDQAIALLKRVVREARHHLEHSRQAQLYAQIQKFLSSLK